MNPKRWMTIRLVGHGTSIAVPEGMFVEKEGRHTSQVASRWIAPDGSEVSLWNELKRIGTTLESLFKQESTKIEMVTRSELESDGFLVLGFDADWFVHRRIKIGLSGRVHAVEMRYLYTHKSKYEIVAADVCASLGGE